MTARPSRRRSRQSDVKALTDALYEITRLLRSVDFETALLLRRSPSEIEVLRVVLHEPGVRASVIRERLRARASNISVTVRKLIDAGLVEPRRDAQDGRVTQLFPSRTAVEGMARIEHAWVTLTHAAFERLSDADQARLSSATPSLRALAESLRAETTAASRTTDEGLDAG